MISYNKAKELIIQQAKSFGTEQLLLDDAFNRVINEKIIVDRDYPPFNRSMMDGYAIKISDWENNIKNYQLIETIYAGDKNKNNLQSGQCYKIMTGAAVPNDADVVIKKEESEEINKIVNFKTNNLKPYQHIAKKGEDLKKGEIIFNTNKRYNAAKACVLSSIGKVKIRVEKLPTVAIITTGNEIVSIDKKVSDFEIRNSNAYILKSLLQKWQITPSSIDHLPDDKTQLKQCIHKNKFANILIINGGVSEGDADYIPTILEELGAEKIFHKVAIKPGKPIWFGQFKNGATIFALPGNPFSCMVSFLIFIEPFLSASFNIPELLSIHLPIHGTRKNMSKLDEFFPAIINQESGITPLLINSSGDITAALQANAIAHHPNNIENLIEPNLVKCILL